MSEKGKGKDTNTELVLGHGGSIRSVGIIPLTPLRIAYPRPRIEIPITCISSYLAALVQRKTNSAYMSGRLFTDPKIG
jgi:hypothetical protein